MKRTRLLYLHNTPLVSGKANLNQVIQMCNAFAKNECDVTLAIPESNITIQEANEILFKQFQISENINIEFIRKISSNETFNKYLYHLRINKIFRKVNPDFCFVRNPFFLFSCYRLNIPTIYESHNSLTHERSIFLNHLITRMLLWLSKKESTRIFITISSSLQQFWVKKGVPKEKVIALHDGFNDNYYLNVIEQSHAKRNLEIDIGRKVIVYTGSLNPERGIDQIVLLAQRLPDVLFYLLGGPKKYEDYFKEACENLKLINVKFVGFIDQAKIHHYLYAADVLLAIWTNKVKTINYCSPLKLFEYMAAGRIMVAAGFPTIHEVVTDGETAFIYDPNNFNDLFDAILKALNCSYPSSIALKARTVAFEKYTWDRRVKAILNSLTIK